MLRGLEGIRFPHLVLDIYPTNHANCIFYVTSIASKLLYNSIVSQLLVTSGLNITETFPFKAGNSRKLVSQNKTFFCFLYECAYLK